ncbi:MAG TPA: ribosome silencing factor [Chitinophagales bacterium]|nr:ribosome silencing factor [Chitinophagales bacterium]
MVNCILDKKGEQVVNMDLSNLDDAIADNFIICTANSNTQVRAIADEIAEKVKLQTGESSVRTEGTQTAEWILIDYFQVVVHVFKREIRDLYRLEELWADAAVATEYLPDGSTQPFMIVPQKSKPVFAFH